MDDNFDKLRRALLGTDIDRLNFLQAQLEDRETFKSKVAENLTAATTQSHINSNKYSFALKDPVIDAIGHGSLSQPAELAKSLGPVMMPAIAAAVAKAVAELKQSMDETITSSFTLKGLKWRREAARTGLPYGTIALRQTLKFQAEHVFLASKRTGAIISDVLPNGQSVGYIDPESTHGKYRSAVKQLALSAVITKYPEDVQTMPAGESNIHVAHSAWATLALVAWGESSLHVKAAVQETLDTIEREFNYEIKNFAGDTKAFEVANIRLKSLFEKTLNQPKKTEEVATAKPNGKWKLWLTLASLAALACIGYYYFENKEKAALEKSLASEPSFLLSNIEGRLGHWRVQGLADPAGFSAEKALSKAGLDASSASFKTKPFLSLDPAATLARAKNKLLPPNSVILSINPSTPTTLTVSGGGDAPVQKWTELSLPKALTVPGIDSVDIAALIPSPPVPAVLPDYSEQLKKLEDMQFIFSTGSQMQETLMVDQAVKLIFQLQSLAQDRKEKLRFNCLGHVDGNTNSSTNESLMLARANALCTALSDRGVDRQILSQQAAGASTKARIATIKVSGLDAATPK
jgi:hypothetical protein